MLQKNKTIKDYVQQNTKKKLFWFSSFKKPRKWNDNSNNKIEQQWLNKTADTAEMEDKPKTYTNMSPEKIYELRVGKKFKKSMREYGKGELHSGSKNGPIVDNWRQAVAISASQQRKADEKRRKK